MEALFKKYFWVIKGLGIAAATGLAASAIITWLGTKMVLDTEGGDAAGEAAVAGEDDEDAEEGLDFGENPFGKSAVKPSKSSSSKQLAKNRTADEIRKRNIFCPNCVPPVPEGAVPGMPGVGPTAVHPGEIRSSLPLKLISTMEATDPQYSLATVFDADNASSGAYAIDDEIRPGVVVVGIEQSVLHLRNQAQLEYIEIGGAVAPTPQPTTPAPEGEGETPPPGNGIPGMEDSINCPNENTCIVERKFVDQVLANPALLAKQARIVPSQKDGETQGFKFYGIRRGSLPKALGLKNGDMITEINGEAIDSVDKAWQLYMKLRRASNLSVTIVRKGQPISKEIQIQ